VTRSDSFHRISITSHAQLENVTINLQNESLLNRYSAL